MNSKIIRQVLAEQQEIIKTCLKNIIGERKLNLNRSIVFASHEDDGSLNETIIAIDKDLDVDTDFNYDVAEKIKNITDFSLEIQLAVLEQLENNMFNEE